MADAIGSPALADADETVRLRSSPPWDPHIAEIPWKSGVFNAALNNRSRLRGPERAALFHGGFTQKS